ncbi:MAG: DUF2461 domain-containing protein [Nocardioides sp.]
MSDFAGFPDQALDFYDDLEVDNTQSYWEKHKATYDRCVKAPMTDLCAALAPEFGPGKVFRPYRDVRFAKDKTPYKTHQGAFVAAGPATGWYVELSARGLRVGAGFYEASGARLASIREAMAHDITGPQLERLVADYDRDGWEIGGEQLKTSPRGYPADHPRIDLLRRKQLFVGRPYGFEDLDDPAVLDRVREDWRGLRPLVEWIAAHAAE